MDQHSRHHHHHHQRPYPYLLPSSTPSDVYERSSSVNSVSSLSSIMSATSSSGAPQQHPTSPASPSQRRYPQLSQAHFQSSVSAAPLPSPTMGQPSQYFESIQERARAQASQEMHMQIQMQMQREMQAQQQYQQQQQQQQQRNPAQGPFDYRPNRGDAGSTALETNNFLRDYGLLAEAAKRAQMAVLERDLGGMDMS